MLATEYPPVFSKQDMVRRYSLGEFGNASPTWQTPSEFVAGGYEGLCHLRNRVAGGPTFYNLDPGDLLATWYQQRSPECWYASAMAPTEKTLLQGELMDTEQGLYLYYSQVRKPMRDALKERAQEARGLMALGLLKLYQCVNSYEWTMELLQRYPGHVVEFSTYSTCFGTITNRNTCFWEVRKY